MKLKKQLKRILALSTAFSIIFSNNAFATPIDLTNSTENVIVDDLNKTDGTDYFTDEDTNIWNEGEIFERIDVTVQRESQFEITIPKDIVLDGESGTANYIVNAKGDIAGNQLLKVMPDFEFDLINIAGKENILATVTQDDIYYRYENLLNNGTDYTGNIEAPLTAGEWVGSFYFNINFEQHTHSYNSEITLEQTCTEKGIKTYTCECNHTYNEDIPANGHVEIYAGEIDTHIKCKTCDEPLITVHEYDIEVTLDSTCVDTGIKTYTCECGYTYDEEISANGHTYEHIIEPSTCTQNGSEYDKCSVCDNVINNIELDMLEHELELIETTTNGDKRTNKYKCKNCEYTNSITETYLYNFNYTGNIQEVTLGPGTYKLETWGAQGGNDTWRSSTYNAGGYGGYSYGEITFNTPTTLYVVVGGQGPNTESTSGNGNSYNGGGAADGHGSGGGGATHIATANGVLSSLGENKESILIVAGGGGGIDYGGSWDRRGGDGGGGTMLPDVAYGTNKQATTNTGYSFGKGEYVGGSQTGSGGGGYYGGFIGISDDQGGGGGSSGGGGSAYLSDFLNNTGGTKGVRTGNGSAKITKLL